MIRQCLNRFAAILNIHLIQYSHTGVIKPAGDLPVKFHLFKSQPLLTCRESDGLPGGKLDYKATHCPLITRLPHHPAHIAGFHKLLVHGKGFAQSMRGVAVLDCIKIPMEFLTEVRVGTILHDQQRPFMRIATA